MAFHEVRLPEEIERGAQGGPMFRTSILTLSSGHEKRNEHWSQARGEWDIGYGIDTLDDLREVITFFYARRGQAHGFRFKDWSDYQVERQTLATGDGTTDVFQLFKEYDDGFNAYNKTLKKIVAGTLNVWVNGSPSIAFTSDANAGTIDFISAPTSGHLIEFECEFDIPVRFATDKLEINLQTFQAGSIPSIPIIELRV